MKNIHRMMMMESVAHITIPRFELVSETLVEDFEDVSEWTKTAGVDPVQDTTNFNTGSKSIRITNSGAYSTMDKVISPSWDISQSHNISIFLYYYGGTGTGSTFMLYLSADSGFSKYMQSNVILNIPAGAPVGWYRFDITDTGDWQLQNGMTWQDPIVKIRVKLVPTNNDCSFDSLYINVRTTETPTVMFTFDDGFDSISTLGLPLFQARKLRATSYVISGMIDTAGYMTAAQVIELVRNGWQIGNHGSNSSSWSGKTQEQIQTSISTCESAMAAKGVTVTKHAAYPGGTYDANVEAVLAASGILTVRGTINAYNGFQMTKLYHLNAFTLGNSLTLATAKTYVDQIITSKKTLCFFGHKLALTAADSLTWADSDLAALLDYIKSRGIPCITPEEYYLLQSQSVVVRK